MNIKGLFGVNSDEHAAALKQFGSNYQGQGELEKAVGQKLSAISMNKIGAYAEVVEGNDDQRKAYYNNIKKNLTGDDVARGDKAFEEGGESLKRFLIDAITKTDQTDPGLEAQKTSVELQNKMASSLSGLVEIETSMKEILMGIWRGVDKDSQQLKNMMVTDRASNGTDVYGDNAYRKKEVVNAVDEIKAATSMDEKKKIASRLLDIYDRQKQTGFPTDTEKLIEDALYPPENKVEKPPVPEEKEGETTLPAETSGSGKTRVGDIAARLMADNPGLKPHHVAGILGNLGLESEGFKTLQERDPKQGRGGAMWTGPRRLKFERYAQDNGLSTASDEANYGYLNQELHGDYKKAISKLIETDNLTDSTRSFMDNYEQPGIKNFDGRMEYARDYMDDVPKQKTDNTQSFKHSIDINLFDANKEPIADKFTVAFNSYIGAPKASGLGQ